MSETSTLWNFLSSGFFLICGGFFVLALLAWITWWFGRLNGKCVYFGTYRLCASVHERLPGWWAQAKKRLSYHPAGMTVLGFLLTPVWPCLIGLNIMLLAPLFDMIVPGGGKRITLPLGGAYSKSGVITGILFAVSQTVLGIMSSHGKSKKSKWAAGFLAVFAILIEFGLSIWRAKLIQGGKQPLAPTFLDQFFFSGGPVLGGFFSLIVASTEVFSGSIAFSFFVEPFLVGLVHWAAGLIAAIWGFFASLIFGFHPILVEPEWKQRKEKEKKPILPREGKIPRWLADLFGRLKRAGRTLAGQKGTAKDFRDTVQQAKTRSDLLKSPDLLKRILMEAAERIGTLDQSWQSCVSETAAAIEKAEDALKLPRLNRDILAAAAQHKNELDSTRRSVLAAADLVRRSPREISRCRAEIDSLKSQPERRKGAVKEAAAAFAEIKKQVEDAVHVLRGQVPAAGSALLPSQVEELKQLRGKALGDVTAALGQTREFWNRIDALTPILEQDLATAEKTLNETESRLPASFPAGEEVQLCARALGIQGNIRGLIKTARAEVRELRRKARRTRKALRRRARSRVLPASAAVSGRAPFGKDHDHE